MLVPIRYDILAGKKATPVNKYMYTHITQPAATGSNILVPIRYDILAGKNVTPASKWAQIKKDGHETKLIE